jgi:hypothetical protein
MEQEHRDDCPLTLAELGTALREAVDETVRAAIRAELAGPFRVDPEIHYQHHQMLSSCVRTREAWEADHAFIAELRRGAGVAQGAAIKSLIAALVTALLAGLVLLFRKV